MTLAKRDWDMIIQELYKDAWLLPESIIDGYIRSDDSSIRQVGAGGQLTYNQAMQLANDSSNDVVTKLSVKAGRDETPWSIVADDATRE